LNSFYLCSSAALQTLSKTAFKVYSFLCISANNLTRASFKSKNTIAKACKISLSSVVRATKELCEKGLLEIKKRFWKNGKQTSNLYILLDNTQIKISPITPQKHSNNNPTNNTTNRKNNSHAPLRSFKCSATSFHMNLSASELKVYSYLSYRAGKDSRCMPSKKDIATDCNISVSTVTRSIKGLQAAGLISVAQQSRAETFSNNGTSVNLYILNANQPIESSRHNIKIHPAFVLRKILFSYLLPFLTPSLMSWVTPQRTISRIKVTLKQRKNTIISKLTKWYRLHKYKKHARHFFSPAHSSTFLPQSKFDQCLFQKFCAYLN
jgi:DNA-binding MarR family transcriptional regulator